MNTARLKLRAAVTTADIDAFLDAHELLGGAFAESRTEGYQEAIDKVVTFLESHVDDELPATEQSDALEGYEETRDRERRNEVKSNQNRAGLELIQYFINAIRNMKEN